MNEQLASTIRQVLLILAGIGPVASILMKIGIDPTQWPAIVDWILGLLGILASGWALWMRSKKQIVVTAATIVPVPPASQAKVGVENPVAPTKAP